MGDFGSGVAEALLDADVVVPVNRIGVPDILVLSTGRQLTHTNSQNWAEKSDLADACYSKHLYQLNLQLLLKTGIKRCSQKKSNQRRQTIGEILNRPGDRFKKTKK